MFQIHLASDLSQRSLGFVIRENFLIQQLKDPARGGQRVLEFRNYPCDLIKGLRVLVGVGEKAGKLSHGQASSDDSKNIRQW